MACFSDFRAVDAGQRLAKTSTSTGVTSTDPKGELLRAIHSCWPVLWLMSSPQAKGWLVLSLSANSACKISARLQFDPFADAACRSNGLAEVSMGHHGCQPAGNYSFHPHRYSLAGL